MMEIKRNIYLMYGISLLQGMVFYGPIATLYRQAAGVSVFEITLIESISLVLCIALEMPWGVVADRAMVLSIYAVLSEGTGVAANLMFGAVAQASLSAAMLCGTVMCAMGAVFFLIWHHTSNRV